MNAHFIIGNLVRDPETGTTPAGVGWTRFVVAVRKRYPKEGEPDAEFMRVTAWRGLGENCAKYLAKGKKVAVVGESRASAWISREDADAPPERAGGDADRVQDGGRQVGFTEVQDEEVPF